MKRIFDKSAARAVIGAAIALYIWFVYRTSKWTRIGEEEARRLFDRGESFIVAVWHGRIGMMVRAIEKPGEVRVLISRHRDGALIASAIDYFGIGAIRGSAYDAAKGKDKGGTEALRAILRAVDAGQAVFVTPDGPRGPRMRVSEGVVRLAQITGVPILPAAYSMRHRRVARSWDRFIVPRPFSRGVYVWGRPQRVPRNADRAEIESCRLNLERELNDVTRRADEMVGHAAIEPDPVVEAI